MMNHLASHGFVVIASLSTTTSKGDPLPTIAGLDWLLQQSEDSSSPYYHRLDTANIGQLGHSEGAMSTCMFASEPRYKALAAISGTRTLSGVHTPMLFFCGGKDTVVSCDSVGGGERRISFGDGRYATPVWSPRGDYIAFTKIDGRRLRHRRHASRRQRRAPAGERLPGRRSDLGAQRSRADVLPPAAEFGRPRRSVDAESIDITGRFERQIPTPTDASDPAWSPLIPQ